MSTAYYKPYVIGYMIWNKTETDERFIDLLSRHALPVFPSAIIIISIESADVQDQDQDLYI